MPHKKSNTVQLGIFVSLALIAFTVGVYKIGMKQNLFGATFSINTIVNNANGLQTGNNVRYAGINVGSVKEINFLNDSTLQIAMTLEDRVKGVIKKDAVASIGSDGLVGNMIVNIQPGKGMAPDVDDGDMISSEARTETKDLLDALDKSSANIAQLTLNLIQITEKINQGSGTLSLLLNDPSTAQDLAATIAEFRKTSKSISGLSNQLYAAVDDVKSGKGLMGYLLKDTSFQVSVSELSGSLDSLINQRTVLMMSNLEKSSTALQKTTSSLQTKIEALEFDQGMAGAVLADSTLAEEFKKIMLNLEQGTAGFQQNMEALKHNFLFRRYFKKLEKKKP